MLAQEQSQNAQNKLREIETWANSESEGRYIKFNPGDVRKLSFSLEKMELATSTFYDQKTGQPRTSKRVNFTVVDLDSPFGEEKIWSASKTWAKVVIEFLKAGQCILSIRRTGSGLKDTKYQFEPYQGS